MTTIVPPERSGNDGHGLIRILILDGIPADAELMEHEIRKTGVAFVSKRVETREAFEKELLAFSPDLILADYNLSSYDGLSALATAQEECPRVPFILVSGTLGEELAVETLKKGATDFVLKKRLFRLGQAVGRALQETKERAKLEKAKQTHVLALQIFELLNQSIGLDTIVKNILVLIKEYIGIEAIAIRLREGEDFPYKETVGFPKEFIEADNCLCSRDCTGAIVRDAQGQICLQSMCGNILAGRRDPLSSFFTNAGSFWTNSTTRLLTSTTEEDQSLTENRCNSTGYESLALIPLRSGNYIIGLLHLADRHPNRFSLDQIHFLEGIGASVGIALRRQASIALIRKSEAQYRGIFENAVEGLFQSTPEGEFLAVNQALAKMYGFDSPADMLEKIRSIKDQLYVIPGDRDELRRLVNGRGVLKDYQIQAYTRDKRKIWVMLNVRSVRDEHDRTLFYEGSAVDITERKLAAEILNMERQRFKTLSEHAPFGIMLIDQVGTVEYINPKFVEVFGYELGEIPLGKVWLRRAYPDSEYRHDVTSTWVEGFKVPDAAKIARVVSVTCKDSSVKTVNIVGVRLEKGKYLMACEDVTERVAFEKQLKESEERYRVAIEYSNDGVAIIREDLHLYANNKYLQIFGYDAPDEVVGKPVYMMVHGDDRMMVTEINRLRREGKPVPAQYEFRGKRKDGAQIVVEVSAAQTLHLGEQVTLAYMRDITDRKRVEEALSLQAQVLDQMHDAVVATDTKGKVTIWNSQAEKLYGYSKEEAVGSHVSFIYSSDDFTYREQKMMPMVKKFGSCRAEITMLKQSGELLPIRVLLSLLRNPRGKVVGIIGYHMDLSDYRGLQDQLNHAQRMEAMGVLAGGIAHDFNNLLSVITGASSLVKLVTSKDSPMMHYLDQIEMAAHKGAKLTQSLRAFSRKEPTNLSPLNLNQVLQGTTTILSRVLTENIELKIEICPQPLPILADPVQVDQVVINLATNARDAMPHSGVFMIKTDFITIEGSEKGSLGLTPGANYATLTVSDTGSGMSAETREQIFDPFFTTKGPEKGTGLGLAVVYNIVKQHQGFITVKSDEGMGTTFTIYLPIRDYEAKVEEPLTLEESPRGVERILVAEDDIELLNLIRDILTGHGYSVIEASDGTQAVDLYRNSPAGIDLLFLDLGLPKKNGFEVYKDVRTLNPGIKVLFTTGYISQDMRDKGLGSDNFPMIQKPFLPMELLRKVRHILDSTEE